MRRCSWYWFLGNVAMHLYRGIVCGRHLYFSSFSNIRLCLFTIHINIHSPKPNFIHSKAFLPCSVGFLLSNAIHPSPSNNPYCFSLSLLSS
ncbi:hypothetical protein VNO77_24290 [Canavalia gladiata]|uniref:Uncharacterized protein n=1 Tax=Canavalia gladiata TaxID=3824 RepID=A0AAN9L6H8_CANGL